VEGRGTRAQEGVLGVELLQDIAIRVPDRLESLGVDVSDGDIEGLLDLHDQFHGVEAHRRPPRDRMWSARPDQRAPFVGSVLNSTGRSLTRVVTSAALGPPATRI